MTSKLQEELGTEQVLLQKQTLFLKVTKYIENSNNSA